MIAWHHYKISKQLGVGKTVHTGYQPQEGANGVITPSLAMTVSDMPDTDWQPGQILMKRYHDTMQESWWCSP